MTARVATYVRAGRPTRRAAGDIGYRSARLCATVAHWPGCVVVASYGDVSDPRDPYRPDLAALLADATARRFDAVVVESLDPLAADPATRHALFCQLAATGTWVRPLSGSRRARAAGWAAVAMMQVLRD